MNDNRRQLLPSAQGAQCIPSRELDRKGLPYVLPHRLYAVALCQLRCPEQDSVPFSARSHHARTAAAHRRVAAWLRAMDYPMHARCVWAARRGSRSETTARDDFAHTAVSTVPSETDETLLTFSRIHRPPAASRRTTSTHRRAAVTIRACRAPVPRGRRHRTVRNSPNTVRPVDISAEIVSRGCIAPSGRPGHSAQK